MYCTYGTSTVKLRLVTVVSSTLIEIQRSKIVGRLISSANQSIMMDGSRFDSRRVSSRYKLVDALGKGSYGQVSKAVDT